MASPKALWQVACSLGQYTAGFGVINATAAVNTVPTLNGAPRSGTLIARFSF